MIKAFIFDLDGVITDTAEYHYLAWKQLGKDLGINFDREFNETLKGVSRIESLERILALENKENNYTEEEKLDLATKKNEHYVSLINKITPKDILPGINELLDDLREKNIKIGLASASKNAVPVLTKLGLLDKFDYVAPASECKNSKPAPDIFLMAAKGLDINPENCVGIEDAEAGVEAINSANMYSVGVGSAQSMKKANLVFDCTSKLNLDTISKNFS